MHIRPALPLVLSTALMLSTSVQGQALGSADAAKIEPPAWYAPITDPFWPAPPTPPSVPKAAAPAAPVSAPAAPPSPAFDLRYLGSYESADGRRVVFFSKGEAIIAAQAGASLGAGFLLQVVEENRAIVVHPELERPIIIAIGSPPQN